MIIISNSIYKVQICFKCLLSWFFFTFLLFSTKYVNFYNKNNIICFFFLLNCFVLSKKRIELEEKLRPQKFGRMIDFCIVCILCVLLIILLYVCLWRVEHFTCHVLMVLLNILKYVQFFTCVISSSNRWFVSHISIITYLFTLISSVISWIQWMNILCIFCFCGSSTACF